MIIRHLPFHPNFIQPIKDRQKRVTRRPMKVQPERVYLEEGVLQFAQGPDAYRVYLSDYPCPFGEPGDLLMMHVEGGSLPFYQAKVRERTIAPLSEISDEEILLEGCLDRPEFFRVWNEIYGETIYASIFDPWVWVIKFSGVE